MQFFLKNAGHVFLHKSVRSYTVPVIPECRASVAGYRRFSVRISVHSEIQATQWTFLMKTFIAVVIKYTQTVSTA